jgi:GTPase
MPQEVTGNIHGLPPSELKMLSRLFHRRSAVDELVSLQLARELCLIAQKLRRVIGILITRDGTVTEVAVGDYHVVYLPPLGRYRLGSGRLRRLRLIVGYPSTSEPQLTNDLLGDLEKLRLDTVVAVALVKDRLMAEYATIATISSATLIDGYTSFRHQLTDLSGLKLDFQEFIKDLEVELTQATPEWVNNRAITPVILISVSTKPKSEVKASLNELNELARTSGIKVVDTIIQRRNPDPKSVLGKGKLEQVVLHCLRLGIEIIVFDTELRPTQWRIITTLTDLKIIDRSMLILDIFALNAKSNEGRLQVELAQLKYNLPRLRDKDSGLSRLTGGIGGRGPGETKLEIERRRSRERIITLEKQIENIGNNRNLRRQKRTKNMIPFVVIVGYTNVGKSTLFNLITGSNVLAEDKLFATLDNTQRKVTLPEGANIVISDTVGFIRDLPKELINAFKATLEELTIADILIHVADASDERVLDRINAVESILNTLDIPETTKKILVFNKIDKAKPELVNGLKINHPDALFISALKDINLLSLSYCVEENLKEI